MPPAVITGFSMREFISRNTSENPVLRFSYDSPAFSPANVWLPIFEDNYIIYMYNIDYGKIPCPERMFSCKPGRRKTTR